MLAVINSSAASDFPRENRRSNTDLYPDDWMNLPIPDVPPEEQAPVVELVERILATLRSDLNADVRDPEVQIAEAVSRL